MQRVLFEKSVHCLDWITLQVENYLRNDSPQLTASTWETMSSGAISGGEDLPRNNECGDIWAKILEKVRKAIKKHKKFEPQGWLVELLKFEA